MDVYKIQKCLEIWIFAENEGVFLGKGDFGGKEKGVLDVGQKTKRKAPDVSDAVAIFCGI